MAVDGTIDYRGLSQAELDEAAENIDARRFPLNAAALRAELAERRVQVSPPAPRGTPFALEFRGDGAEYFRIWIVNLALTLVTLGVYSAWAKVRRLRYFHGCTSLAGSAFVYHGQPLPILKGRLVAVGLLALAFVGFQFSLAAGLALGAVLLVALPWLLVKSRLFAMRMTSWRGLRFDFVPDYAGAYRTILGWGAAAVVSFGLLTPMFLRARYVFVVTRSRFGGVAFDCQPSAERFMKTGFASGFLALAAFVPIVALVFVVTAAIGPSEMEGAAGQVVSLALNALAYLLVAPLVAAYVLSRNLNEVFRTLSLGPHCFHSDLRAGNLAWVYVRNLLLIAVTLGLYTPWAQVHVARLRVRAVTVLANGSVDAFVADVARRAPAAAGQEIGEFLDLDFGL